MKFTIFKVFFKKQGPKIIWYQNYKCYNKSYFPEQLLD